ncbi:MAG: rod shape-determining protein MreD [Phycisphaerales bacterium]
MNWFVLLFVAWICFGLEMALLPVFDAGASGVSPSVVLPLLVFVALYAPRKHALWCAVVLGISMDLLTPISHDNGGPVTLLGPYALGYLLAAQFIFSVRAMVVRRNPLTIAFLSVLASLIAEILVVAIITMRYVAGDNIAWDAGDALIDHTMSSLYTGIVALFLSFLFFALTPAFGFHTSVATRFARHIK